MTAASLSLVLNACAVNETTVKQEPLGLLVDDETTISAPEDISPYLTSYSKLLQNFEIAANKNNLDNQKIIIQ